MNFIQLFINEPATAELDLNQEMDIALQYSIADIKDISKRNASYSKTIILPGTKKNNYWFGNLFDVNTDFSGFNPNKKIAAKILVNTETVMDGFLQLRKIVKNNETDHQGNMISYEVVIYNNAVDLMSAIGEKTINLLDMSEFGHTFSSVNVKNSWTHTYEDGYVYPMFGTKTKDSQYSVDYFYPAIFYRTILDQMVREAGFGWTGSLMDSDQFNHEVLSYVTDGRPKIDEEARVERLFKVGRTQSYTNTAYSPWYAYQDYQYVSSFATAQLPDETSYTSTWPGYDFFDNGTNWNTSTYQWDVNANGAFTGELTLLTRLKLQNNSGTSTTITRYSSADPNLWPVWWMNVQVEIYNGASWSVWGSGKTGVYGYTGSSITLTPGGSQQFDLNVSLQLPQINLANGNKVRVRYRPTKDVGSWFFTENITVSTEIRNRNSVLTTYFKNNVVVGEITQNEYVNLARYLPDKIKQKDLFTDLIRRYNLYIQTDPDNPRLLIFDTRPDFYDRGSILDWTDKKDYSKVDEIELLSDLQSKLMIWSYKADSDEYNKIYKDVTGDVYGQYKYYFDNDFVKNEERIESSFSPTPLVKTPFNAIVPGINPELPKVQPRLFYYGGLRDCDGWSWTYQPVGGGSASESFTQYPYAGHFDDPINPEIDINFGTCKYYLYDDWSYITDNNMFNTYWSDYIRQIETGRMITSHFYLDENDIRYIKDNFYTKIFVLDSYYYINRIIDYKPLNNDVTKVELIKIVDGIKWEPKKTREIISTTPRPFVPVDSVVIGSGNSTNGGGILVGNNNIASGKITRFLADGTPIISIPRFTSIGSENIINGDNSFIVGDRNTITTNKSLILGGDGNTIEDAENVVLIAANNVTATASGKIYIGDNYVVDATTGIVEVGGTAWSPLVYYTEDTSIPASKVQIINDNLRTITHLWRGASGSEYISSYVLDGNTGNQGGVFIQEDSVALEVGDGSSNSARNLLTHKLISNIIYDNSTLTNVASILLENQTSNGYGVINITGTTNQTLFNLDPANANGGTFWKQQSTTNSNQTYISMTDNNLYQTVYDFSSGESSWINMIYGTIEMTTDSDATHFNISSTGGVLRLNIAGLPATASNPGDVWVDGRGYLRIVP